MEKIAVIAGTPIDTLMGGEFLKSKGLETEEFPVSENPVEQTKFQSMPQETKELEMKKIIKTIKSKEFLKSKGLETEEFPVSENPVEQTKFQSMPQETKELEMKKIIKTIKSKGIVSRQNSSLCHRKQKNWK